MSEPEQLDLKGDVPTGLAHIDMLARFNQRNRKLAQSLLQSHRDDLAMLGRALHVLYLTATCHRKCWGGGHVMEFMAARGYKPPADACTLNPIAPHSPAAVFLRRVEDPANF